MHQLVPEFILENYAAENYHGEFPAVGMFVDISGFTTITDTLMNHGPHGAEVLATLMRRVFTPLIYSVYAHGGMVVNFAGDAFTALFRLDEGHEGLFGALAAGWKMQVAMATLMDQSTVYGDFQLSAKVGLSLGEVKWGIVRAEDGSRAAYYFQGSSVDGCAAAEHSASAGEVLIDPAFYARLGSTVTAQPVGEYLRLTGVTKALPPESPIEVQASNPAIQSRFYPLELLRQTLSGEFRQVVNLFIGLPTVRTDTQLAIFMRSLFHLQDQYGGLLNRLDFGDKGSNLLLFWGAPVAYENDVQRALNFILALQTITSIPINAGVTYQIAHAGFIGSPLREEYTCYGRGVNLAARFMGAAGRGEIWLDEAAARLASAHFEIDHLGNRSFKGFESEQPVYLLYERKEAVQSLFEGELVGREEELARLEAFTEPLWQRRFAGSLMVWGDAGIGKSRLAYEFHARLLEAGQQPVWAVCRAEEISRQSFAAWRYWLREAFEQSQALIGARNKRSFNRHLDDLIGATQSIDPDLAEELDRTRSFLAALLDLHWSDSLYEQLDAQGRYENTVIALGTLIRAESLRSPVVIVMEDAQWLDEDSLHFLPRLLRTLTADETKSFPVALIVIARREGIWERLRQLVSFEELELDALSSGAVERMARAVLKGPVETGLLSLLMERAQGNPFFAEQILCYLQEERALEQGEAGWKLHWADNQDLLPGDVRAVLVARLDRLTQQVKETVQTAAIIGQEFEFRLLARMLKGDETLLKKVAAAESSAIWVALSELRYLFKHALLRDAAYRMQVLARRQELHALAAEALEEIYAPDLKPHYAELAYHTEEANHPDQARTYYHLAGDFARDEYQNNRAASYYTQALELTPEGDFEARFQLSIAREEMYDLLGDRERERSDLKALDAMFNEWEAIDPGLDLGGRKALVAERWANYFNNTSNYPEAIAAAHRAVNLSLRDATPEVEVTARSILTFALVRQGKINAAIEQAELGLELARKNSLRYGESRLLNLLGLIALDYSDSQKARRFFNQSLEIVQEINERRVESQILTNLGNQAAWEGDYAEAWDSYQSSLQISQQIGNRIGEGFANGNLGWVAKIQGDFETAQTYLERTLRIAKEIGNPYQEAYAMTNLGWLFMMRGDFENALTYTERSLSVNRETGDRSGEAWSLTCLGHVHFGLEQLEAAQESYQGALELRRELDQPNFATEPLAGLAQVALAMNDLSKAKTYQRSIQDYLENGGSLDGTEEPLWIYLVCYRVLQAIQDPKAEEVLETAYRQMKDQAGRIQDLALRKQFLDGVTHNREITAAWEAMQGTAPAD